MYIYFTDREEVNISSMRSVSIHIHQVTVAPLSIPATIKEIFLFFTFAIMDLIVEETNRYATTCIGASWAPIIQEKLCAYFGFMLLMGIVKLPSIYDYWQKDEVYHYSRIADRISRKWFFEIYCNTLLHPLRKQRNPLPPGSSG